MAHPLTFLAGGLIALGLAGAAEARPVEKSTRQQDVIVVPGPGGPEPGGPEPGGPGPGGPGLGGLSPEAAGAALILGTALVIIATENDGTAATTTTP